MPDPKYIVALCPETPIFYAEVTEQDIKDNPEAAFCDYAITKDKSQALVFDTFEDAQRIADSIAGWGNARAEALGS